MPKTFFTSDDDFEAIIRSTIRESKSIIDNLTPIPTGWTNFVYSANINHEQFFFRFPRDDFWSRTIIKDCEFAHYISGRTTFTTPKLTLNYDANGRPFSAHKGLPGQTLADQIGTLPNSTLREIGAEIAEFMFQLHTLTFDQNAIFSTNNIGTSCVDFLDELLRLHIEPANRQFWNYDQLSKTANNCLVHGDLNLSNVLLDEDNHVTAIIDFGFSGFGNCYHDVARILSRTCPNSFKDGVIERYNTLAAKPLNLQTISATTRLWQQIDQAYIDYMTGGSH